MLGGFRFAHLISRNSRICISLLLVCDVLCNDRGHNRRALDTELRLPRDIKALHGFDYRATLLLADCLHLGD